MRLNSVAGREHAGGFASVLHSTPMAILERTSSCVRPPCLMSLHASRLTHGMHGCECGSVDADCGSMCGTFHACPCCVRSDRLFHTLRHPGIDFLRCDERVRVTPLYASLGGPRRVQICRAQAQMCAASDGIRRRRHRSRHWDAEPVASAASECLYARPPYGPLMLVNARGRQLWCVGSAVERPDYTSVS